MPPIDEEVRAQFLLQSPDLVIVRRVEAISHDSVTS